MFLSLSQQFFYFLKKDKVAFVCLLFLVGIVLVGVLSPLFWPHSYDQIHGDFLNSPPVWIAGGSWTFPLGTDDLGRDLASRLFYGGRVSFLAGLAVLLFSFLIGLPLGVLSGWRKDWDHWVTGAVDILMSFPGLILAIALTAVLGPGLLNACVAVSFASLPAMIRLVRSLVLREKTSDYVKSAQALGAGPGRLLFYHILPNCRGEIAGQSFLLFSEGVLSVAALGFLGLGARPPLPEWGLMIADGRDYLESAWWLSAFPGVCLLIMIFCVNILGEKLK